MNLLGFIHPGASNLFEEINEDLSPNQIRHLAEKVFIVESQGIGFYPEVGSKDFMIKFRILPVSQMGGVTPALFIMNFIV